MKKMGVIFLILAAFGMGFVIRQGPALAAQPEKLYVCGPCSSYFIEEARAVVDEMGVADIVTVRRSSGLGVHAGPYLVVLRNSWR